MFCAFNEINYKGPFTFETTRGNDPVNTAKYNINLVNFFKQPKMLKKILFIGLGGAGQRHLRLFKKNLIKRMSIL